MKRFKILCAVLGLSVLSSITAYAGQWQQAGSQWKYQSDDGSYLTGWQWLDGNGDNIAECYYLNNDGIMLANCTTPDNYTVNADGQWVQNGIVQTKILGNDTPTSETTPPKKEVPTTGRGQSMADVFPGWEGGEIDIDDIQSGGAAGSWH